MKAMRHLVLAASATILLAACATTTPYQAASKPGGFDGYSQTMLDNKTARVTFGGNSLTDRETVENYLLYRAAEMAVEKGYENFTLANRDTEKNSRVRVSPGLSHGFYDPYFSYSFYRPRYGWSAYNRYSYFQRPFGRSRGWGFMGYNQDPFFNNYNVRETTKYRASAEVMFGHGSSAGADNRFNAREILQNLSPVMVFPEQDG